MQLSAISILNIGPESKAQIVDFADQIFQEVESGNADPLDVHIRAKAFINSLEQLISQIESKALAEAQKHAQKSFSFHGAKIEIKEMGTKWFFDKTGDPQIKKIEQEKALISQKEKDRQLFLKSITEKTSILDEETGELFTVYPAYKKSKTGIAITF